MEMTLKIIPEADFLKVIVAGSFSLEEAQRTFLYVINAVREHKSEKVLFDGSNLTGEPQRLERLCYVEFVTQMCQKFLSKSRLAPMFAYVLKEPVLDPDRYGETIAANRGMIVRAFDNLDEACEWLGSHTSINSAGQA